MMKPLSVLISLLCLFLVSSAHAGLYNRAEPAIPLDADLRRFLGQLAEVRSYGPPDFTVPQESKGRKDYLAKVQQLRAKGRLSVEDQANLGAYLVRLRSTRRGIPDFEEAIQVLQAARRVHPRDFYVLANLGAAYQLTGSLDAAESCIQEALALAPPELQLVERYHLQLIRLRARERPTPGLMPLDRLFTEVRFDQKDWKLGSIAAAERHKLSPDAVKIVKQLLVWLPDDGRLHWLLGELANIQGDVRAAHKAMDLAVNLFRLSTPELKQRRLLLQDAVAKLPATGPDLSSLIPDERPAQSPIASSSPLANLSWQGWTIIAVGSLLVVGLLSLQIREFLRRTRRSV